jgi:hypothetical protein
VRRARRRAARRGCSLRVMFADEARFGRMNRPRPCWAPRGTRPQVASQLIREYVYLYGAVSPKDGTCVYLILPAPDTQCFQIFLNTLAKKYPSAAHPAVRGRRRQSPERGSQGSGQCHIARAPTLFSRAQPPENLWDEIREKIFKNYALKSMDEAIQNLRRLHSTSNATRPSSNPSRRSPTSSSQSDIEMV